MTTLMIRGTLLGALTMIGGAAAAQEAPVPGAARPAPPMVVGPLALRGYALREVRFDRPYRVIRDDGTPELKQFGWQVVLQGDHFPSRALDPILWLDDVPLLRYERCQTDGPEELVYTFFDPTLLRSEHVIQVIYGEDERTRTRLLERFDPERLEKLPAPVRAALGMPELEFLTLGDIAADGSVAGRGRLAGGTVRLAARLADGSLRPLAGAATLAADGTFRTKVAGLSAGATHLAALLVPAGAALPAGDLRDLPKGVELLDSKPLGFQAPGK